MDKNELLGYAFSQKSHHCGERQSWQMNYDTFTFFSILTLTFCQCLYSLSIPVSFDWLMIIFIFIKMHEPYEPVQPAHLSLHTLSFILTAIVPTFILTQSGTAFLPGTSYSMVAPQPDYVSLLWKLLAGCTKSWVAPPGVSLHYLVWTYQRTPRGGAFVWAVQLRPTRSPEPAHFILYFDLLWGPLLPSEWDEI